MKTIKEIDDDFEGGIAGLTVGEFTMRYLEEQKKEIIEELEDNFEIDTHFNQGDSIRDIINNIK